MIAVIDTKTVELKEKIDIKIRPFNIFAGKNGYLYVTSREPQKAYLIAIHVPLKNSWIRN